MTVDRAEAKRAYKAAWFQANKARIREAKAADRERIRAYNREYQRTWREANREDVRAYLAAWYESNRDRVKAYATEHQAERRAAQALRRARKATTRIEPFTEAAIFERDGWVCGLCSGPVDPTLRYPDPMCKSIDHIVPLARNGSHTADNVQLAHLRCNMRKGALNEVDRQSQ